MASQHSSSRTSLPSLGSSTVCTPSIRSHQEKCRLVGLDLVSRLSVRHRPCKYWDLPRSWTALVHLCPALRPRMDSLTRPIRRASSVPADTTTKTPIDESFRGSITQLQCSLRAPCAAWSASQDELPHHHARLASGCWPALPGGIGYPLGCYEKFLIPQSIT